MYMYMYIYIYVYTCLSLSLSVRTSVCGFVCVDFRIASQKSWRALGR